MRKTVYSASLCGDCVKYEIDNTVEQFSGLVTIVNKLNQYMCLKYTVFMKEVTTVKYENVR